jgi:glycosyltransferase involved in cell wall biosynthesis
VGGIQVHGLAFCQHLARIGADFRVLTWRPESKSDEAECREFDSTAELPILRTLPRGDLEATLAECASHRADVVYTSQMTLARAFQAPVVARTAANDFLRPWIADQEHARDGALRCRSVICNSQWTAARLGEFAPGAAASVVLGGVDVDRFQPFPMEQARRALGWDPDQPVLMLAGRHVLKKGIDVAIAALALLRDLRIRMVLVGTGPETPNLERLSAEMGVADRVDFLGMLPHELMPLYLNAVDLVLFPSRDADDPGRGGIDYESMGRLPCEAAACGKPVVAADVGGVGEVVLDGDTGLLVPPNAPDRLAGSIERILGDHAFRARLGDRARQRAVAELSFDRVNRETERILGLV